MSTPISLKINLAAIDPARVFKGQKGSYLDAVLIPTPNGKYGDYMIAQSVTKDERLAGKKGAILGNGKTLGGVQSHQSAPATRKTDEAAGDVPY